MSVTDYPDTTDKPSKSDTASEFLFFNNFWSGTVEPPLMGDRLRSRPVADARERCWRDFI